MVCFRAIFLSALSAPGSEGWKKLASEACIEIEVAAVDWITDFEGWSRETLFCWA